MAKKNLITEPLEEPVELADSSIVPNSHEESSTPTSGRRQSLINIRRQLTNEELSQTGTQKMLLDMLEESENQAETLKSFVINYYESDKRAAILSEKLNADRSIEIFFGVGVGLGGALLGLSPFFWDLGIGYGLFCIILGVCLIIGASIGRAVKK